MTGVRDGLAVSHRFSPDQLDPLGLLQPSTIVVSPGHVAPPQWRDHVVMLPSWDRHARRTGAHSCGTELREHAVQLTDDAASMIVDLVEGRALPDGAGLRIAPRPDHPALAMALVERAAPLDVVVRADRARLFLAPDAHRRLAGEVLDARRSSSGSAFFVQP